MDTTRPPRQQEFNTADKPVTETEYLCALLRPLVGKHRYGAPIVEDELVGQAAFESHEEDL